MGKFRHVHMKNFNTYGTSLFLKSAGVDAHEEFIPLFWLPSLFHYCGALWELSQQLKQLGFRALNAAPLVFDGAHPCKVVMGQTLSQPGLELLLPPLCAAQPLYSAKKQRQAPSFRAALRSVSRTSGTFGLGWTPWGHLLQCPSLGHSQLWSHIHFEAQSNGSAAPPAKLSASQRLQIPHLSGFAPCQTPCTGRGFTPALSRGVHCLQPSQNSLSLLPYTDFLLTLTAPSLSRLPSPSPRDLISSPWYSAATLARMDLPHYVRALLCLEFQSLQVFLRLNSPV